jgi:uncharacterized glyoxalase superfamily metalloenzyme YdcJ
MTLHASQSSSKPLSSGKPSAFADRIAMQHRLFAELSSMFGKEVPLYDKALEVNRACNGAVCGLLAKLHPGFSMTDEELEKTSGERHGAIRIGRPDEYRWIARFFAQFGMEPHNFYDMTSIGAKSQPIVATAFRSRVNPDHRVFTSLLMTDYFDPAVRARIEAILATRQVFSDESKALIEKAERQGGLDWADATALIREGTERIFKWTGKARDFGLYKDLSDSGFKIAADIACFERHHLNHLTPNTLCMDLYTSAMKLCMGEMDEAAFRARATAALTHLVGFAGKDWMRLHFKHTPRVRIDALGTGSAPASDVTVLVDALVARLAQTDMNLKALKHNGYKDFTEGPSEDTPVFLRQDAYKALTEPVTFTNPDGTTTQASHTARFGEIEQRFYACTPEGRKLYDECLAIADAAREKDPGLPKRDFAGYERLFAEPFKKFPKMLAALVEQGLVYAKYSPTAAGLAKNGELAARGTRSPYEAVRELVSAGHARIEGLRYEDFLPVSAAGIFASNLNQYGTKSTAYQRPTYTQAQLEAIMGMKIIDTDAQYRELEAQSIKETLAALCVN